LDDTHREVSFQEGEALARELGIGFVESSAKSEEKPMEPVHYLVRECRRQRDELDKAESGVVVGKEVACESLMCSTREKVALLFKDILKKIN
jgi:hypothetical protein